MKYFVKCRIIDLNCSGFTQGDSLHDVMKHQSSKRILDASRAAWEA